MLEDPRQQQKVKSCQQKRCSRREKQQNRSSPPSPLREHLVNSRERDPRIAWLGVVGVSTPSTLSHMHHHSIKLFFFFFSLVSHIQHIEKPSIMLSAIAARTSRLQVSTFTSRRAAFSTLRPLRQQPSYQPPTTTPSQPENPHV